MIARRRPRTAEERRAPWKAAWREARSWRERIGWIGLYLTVRLWTLIINCFPVETNLRTARLLGRIWWLAIRRHRERALEHLRPAFAGEYDERALREIARRSFEHFAQLYLVEMVMTPRLVNEWSWARYVELDDVGPAIRLLLEKRGVILLTAHYGNFELMGYTMARLGFPMHAVMRPLDNPLLTDLLVQSRAAGGLELIFKHGASARFEEILDAGEPLSFIADQDAGSRGVFSPFFGRAASWYKSIGLLAVYKNVPVVVGCARRIGAGFRYRIELERVMQPEEWADQPNPVGWLTDQYAAALERCIRRSPEQYLWVHRRWKSRPRGETAAPAPPQANSQTAAQTATQPAAE